MTPVPSQLKWFFQFSLTQNQAAGLLIGLHIAETTVHKDPPFGLMFNQVDGAVARYDNGDGPLMESLRIHMRQDGSIGLDDLLANFISRRTLALEINHEVERRLLIVNRPPLLLNKLLQWIQVEAGQCTFRVQMDAVVGHPQSTVNCKNICFDTAETRIQGIFQGSLMLIIIMSMSP